MFKASLGMHAVKTAPATLRAHMRQQVVQVSCSSVCVCYAFCDVLCFPTMGPQFGVLTHPLQYYYRPHSKQEPILESPLNKAEGPR